LLENEDDKKKRELNYWREQRNAAYGNFIFTLLCRNYHLAEIWPRKNFKTKNV